MMLKILKLGVLFGVVIYYQNTFAETDFTGTWKSYEFNGIDTSQAPECMVLQFVERTYGLQEYTSEVSGSYTKLTYGIFIHENGSCKYRDQKNIKGIFASGATWTVVADKGPELNVSASDPECMADGCSEIEMKTFAKEWQSRLKIENQVLLDVDSADSSKVFYQFRSEPDLSEKIEEVFPTLGALRKNIIQLDASSLSENFIGPYSPRVNNMTTIALRKSLEQAAPIYNAVENTEVLRSFYADKLVHSGGTIVGPFVLILSRLGLENGFDSLETAVFKYSDDEWKYFFHYIQVH